MLTEKNFVCKNCGKCCMTFTVKLSDKDIKRIETMGYNKDFFAEKDDFDIKLGKYALKRPAEKCIFLKERDNKFFCAIYDARPEICRNYPFNENKSIEKCEPENYRR